jgi:hypothetical protein
MVAVPVLIAALAGWAVGATARDEPGPDGLVIEEVEPGVERIISDDAGHDLDERHPTSHYDMDHVSVAGDGTILLQSTYHGADNDAHPPGAFVWALGEPGTTGLPDVFNCETNGMGVTCIDQSGEATIYLADTPINEVRTAPDGTVWAVGDHDGENGGLYRITPH